MLNMLFFLNRLEKRQSMQGKDRPQLRDSMVIPSKRREDSIYGRGDQQMGSRGTETAFLF